MNLKIQRVTVLYWNHILCSKFCKLVFVFREIWSRFLAFESEVGDLACIQKVEKRRAQAIEKVC